MCECKIRMRGIYATVQGSTHTYNYAYAMRHSCMESDLEERGGTLRECVRAKRTCETQEDRDRGLSRNSEREPERRARETQQERERRDLEHARERMEQRGLVKHRRTERED